MVSCFLSLSRSQPFGGKEKEKREGDREEKEKEKREGDREEKEKEKREGDREEKEKKKRKRALILLPIDYLQVQGSN